MTTQFVDDPSVYEPSRRGFVPLSQATPETGDSTLDAELTRVERAAAEVERKRRTLFRSDGVTTHIPEEHAVKMAALDAELAGVFDRAGKLATDERASVEAAIDKLEHGDIMDVLTASELAKAASRMPFVEQDAQHLSLTDLVARLRVVESEGDRSLIALWLRNGRLRLGREQERPRSNDPMTSRAQLELRQRLAALQDLLTPPEKRKALDSRLDTLRAYDSRLSAKHRILTNAVAKAQAQMKAHGVGRI